MNILLTGGTGFLGRALARYWAGAGHKLTLLLRPDSDASRVGLPASSLNIVRAGTTDLAELFRQGQVDAVIHTACAYGRRDETPLLVLDTNVRLGMQLLDAIGAGEREVSFLNAGSILGPDVSLYALSKHQFSQWGRALALLPQSKLQFLDLHLQHMYGPHDDASKFTTHVLRACRSHQEELALTAGEQRRDFIYIDDVLSAFDTVLGARDRLQRHEDFEVGTGEAPTVREFVEHVHAATGSRTRLAFGAVPYRPNEAMLCRADIGRLASLGWAPHHSLGDGILKTIELEKQE